MNLPGLDFGATWDTSQLLVDGTLLFVPAKVFTVGDVSPSSATNPWEIDGDLTVGNTGEGSLNIRAGGVVSNTWGRIGSLSGSVGTATVTGEGSEWNNSYPLYVGDEGTGYAETLSLVAWFSNAEGLHWLRFRFGGHGNGHR